MYLVCRLLLEAACTTPDLPSFPTRRSSDLHRPRGLGRALCPRGAESEAPGTRAGTQEDPTAQGDNPRRSSTALFAPPVPPACTVARLAAREIGRAHV